MLRLLEEIDRTYVRPLVVFAEEGPMVEKMCLLDIEALVIPLAGRVREVRKEAIRAGAFLRIGQIATVFAYAWKLARFVRKNRVQIIHTNSMKAHIYGLLTGLLTRRPVVWHIRDYIDPSYLPVPAVRLIRGLARYFPAYVIGISRSVLEKVELPSNRKSRVVHDGLTNRELAERTALTENSDSNAPARIGIVGRIGRWKGQHIFLEAAAKVLRDGYKAKFVIIGAPLFGEEAYQEELLRQVEAAGIAAEVEFMGFQNDVPAVMRSLDILVHASISPEPFGQVVIEGMAEGIPVIGSDGGGVQEILEDGTSGMLVALEDAAGLADSIESLLRDPERARQMGQAGYQRVRTHFTVAQTARNVEQIYAEVLGKRR